MQNTTRRVSFIFSLHMHSGEITNVEMNCEEF